MRFRERIAVNPRLEGFPILPASNDEHLVLRVGLEDLHGYEPWKPLYVSAAFGEAVYDLIGGSFFDGQAVEDRDHSYLRVT
jgi:hypothetical protein